MHGFVLFLVGLALARHHERSQAHLLLVGDQADHQLSEAHVVGIRGLVSDLLVMELLNLLFRENIRRKLEDLSKLFEGKAKSTAAKKKTCDLCTTVISTEPRLRS